MLGKLKLNKASPPEEEKEIHYDRVSVVDQSLQNIYVSHTKTTNLLNELNQTSDTIDAIELIIDNTPDGKMAYNTYLRLANQGFSVVWKNQNTGKTVKKYDAEFRSFCSKMGKNNSSGIDGILDQLHGSSIARGAMAVEVVVSKKANDIEEIVIVDPASITEFKWIDSEQRYAMYQQQSGGAKVDLNEGNFFYIPHEPKPGNPVGTLQFAPAVTTITQYLQLFNDSMTILNRIGYPRYDISIDRKALMESCSDKSAEGQKKYFNEVFNHVKSTVRGLNMNSDFIHFDEVNISAIGGGVNGAGIDVRAWFEVLEPLITNSFQLTPVLMGRLKGGSYSLGSVEFKIVTDTVDSMRRGSKRILEEIFKLWARVKGYPIYPVVEYYPIDWEKEIEKLNTQLKRMEVNRRAEEYGYIDSDAAARDSMNVENAANANSSGLYEYLSKNFKESETQSSTSNNPVNQNENTGGEMVE